jgi:UDP:flavonoid glycosyltransferase YjiC (YdhE family)
MATIILYTEGTLGDHLPFIALGQALTSRGHRVRLVMNQALHPYARRAGIATTALTDILRGPEHARAHAWAWNHWHEPTQEARHHVEPFNPERLSPRQKS